MTEISIHIYIYIILLGKLYGYTSLMTFWKLFKSLLLFGKLLCVAFYIIKGMPDCDVLSIYFVLPITSATICVFLSQHLLFFIILSIHIVFHLFHYPPCFCLSTTCFICFTIPHASFYSHLVSFVSLSSMLLSIHIVFHLFHYPPCFCLFTSCFICFTIPPICLFQ